MAVARRSTPDNLKIGDTVLLFYTANEESVTDSGHESGYILADLSGSSKTQLLMVQPSRRNDPNLPDIQLGTFKILAANRYEAQTRYQGIRRKHDIDNCGQAEREILMEQTENSAMQKCMKGSNVCYGDNIQLLHTLTGKYVCVSNKENSITETTKIKLFLQKKDSVECIFRLQPHIKVNTIGKEVNYSDLARFESVATKGQFLHCSRRRFSDMMFDVNSECFELNLAASFSSLQIVPHYQPSYKSDNSLRASTVVRFFIREHECYMRAEGSFVGESGMFSKIQTSSDGPIRMPTRHQKSAGAFVPSSIIGWRSKRTELYRSVTLPLSAAQHDFLNDDLVKMDVHFKAKRKAGGLSTPPSTSPCTFWKIERVNDELCSGEPMEWSEPCRIKHLLTGRYLAVSEYNTMVTLKSSEMPLSSTVFEFLPVVKQVGCKISCDSLVQLKHKDTGACIHMSKDLLHLKREGVEDSYGTNVNEFGVSRQFYSAVATKEMSLHSTFILEMVEDDLIADFHYVASITAALKIKCVKQSHSLESQIGSTLSCLNTLKSLLSPNDNERHDQIIKDKDVKNRQKFVRSMKTLELVILILNLHTKRRDLDQSVGMACFEVIKLFLESSSSKNKMYVSHMIDHIFTQSLLCTKLSDGQSVVKILIRILRDNLLLLYEKRFVTRVNHHLIKELSSITNKYRPIELLEGLSALCSCKGLPIKQNQTMIMEHFQRTYDDRQKILYPFRAVQCHYKEIGKSFHNRRHVSVRMEEEGSSHYTVEFQALTYDQSGYYKSGSWYQLSKGSRVILNFILSQLHLLVAMCRGNNQEVIAALQGAPGTQSMGIQLNFQFIMSAISDKKLRLLRPQLRAVLVELLRVMYVEVEDYKPFLELFSMNFNTVEKIIPMRRKSSNSNDNILFISKWINCFLMNESEYFFAADENNNNEVVVQVLQLLAMLIKFGKYGKVDGILPAIFKLLNGKEDYPTANIKNSRKLLHLTSTLNFNYDDTAHLIYHTREDANSTLTDPTDCNNCPIIHSHGYFVYTETEESHNRASTLSAQEEKHTFSKEMQDTLTEFRDRGGRYEYREQHHNHYEIKYWCMEVVNLLFGLHLCKNVITLISDFKAFLKWNSVLESPDFDVLKVSKSKRFIIEAKEFLRSSQMMRDSENLPTILLDLANYEDDKLIHHSLLLLDSYYTSESSIFQKALRTSLLKTEESCALHERIKTFKFKFVKNLMTASYENEASSVIRELTKCCWLEDEVEGFEPHHINQNIILSFGILLDVLNYVIRYQKATLSAQNDFLLIDCLVFLRVLACQNQVVQTRLLQHLDLFLNFLSGKLSSYAGELICEIFSGGPLITLKVKKEQVLRMMQLFFANGKEISDCLVHPLQELLLVKKYFPLKHNQHEVAKNFSFIREDSQYWCQELLAEGKRSYRWNILTTANGFNSEKKNLLMMTDLLATCAYGDNTGLQSTWCTIYSEDELIEIISSSQISLYSKRPFMKFLVWVYLNLKEDDDDKFAAERAKFYRTNKKLWDHISEMATVLLHTSEAMKDMSHASYLSVKELLISPAWKYSHMYPDRKHVHSPPDIVIKGKDIEERFNISDVLLYLGDGFLFFLKLFYKYISANKVDDPWENQIIFQMEGDTTNRIYKALLSMHTSLNCKRIYFSADIQSRLYSSVLLTIESRVSPLCDELQNTTEELRDTSPELLNQEFMSMTREKYNLKYSEEIKLNEMFKQFVISYKTIYEGKNTKREQIRNIQLSTEPYSEPGPKYLPLGKSFQEHVSIFKEGETEYKKNPKERLLKKLELKYQGASCYEIDSEEKAELDIKCLQILRALIYNRIILIDREDMDRNPKKFRSACKHYVYPIQNEIQRLGSAISRVSPLLTHENELIVHQVLAFLESLLEFGNCNVQQGLKDLISREYQIFPTLQKMLRSTAVVYKERFSVQSGAGCPSTNNETAAKEYNDKQRSKVQGDPRVPFLEIYQFTDSHAYSMELYHYSNLHQVSLIAKVLSLMCDGQQREMQNFLREQNESINSINVVGELSNILYELYSNRVIYFDTLPVLIEILKALIEMCVGNYKNQQVVFNNHIMSVINFILQIDITEIKDATVNTSVGVGLSTCTRGQTEDIDYIQLLRRGLELKGTAVDLMEVMLEEIDVQSKKFSHQLAGGLDVHALRWSMVDFFKLKNDKDLINLKYDDDAYRALFRTYKILLHLVDNGVTSLEKIAPVESEPDVLLAWNYCAEKSYSVEIVYRNQENDEGILTKAYFDMDYKFEDRKKNAVLYQVDHSNHSDKIRDFQQSMWILSRDIQHHKWLKRHRLSLVSKMSLTRWWLLNILTLIINIIVIIGLQVPSNELASLYTNESDSNIKLLSDSELEESDSNTIPVIRDGFRPAMIVVGIFHLLFAIWAVMEYFIVKWPHFVFPEFMLGYSSIMTYLRRFSTKFDKTNFNVRVFGLTTSYMLIFLLSSFFSLVFGGYFYSICLFYIVIDNDILQRALLSLVKNWKSLLWVGALLLSVAYIYALVTFIFFRESFDNTRNILCENLADCFFSVTRFGMIDHFLDVDVVNYQDLWKRFLFDLSFFVIITTVGLNLVFGIILDAFSELRNARTQAEQYIKKACFICGLPRHKFDKQSYMGFERHIKNDHNMWNYIYYSVYLDQIDTSNHNAIEFYVHEKIKSGNIFQFLPIDKALVLENEADEEESLNRGIRKLYSIVKEHLDTADVNGDTDFSELQEVIKEFYNKKI